MDPRPRCPRPFAESPLSTQQVAPPPQQSHAPLTRPNVRRRQHLLWLGERSCCCCCCYCDARRRGIGSQPLRSHCRIPPLLLPQPQHLLRRLVVASQLGPRRAPPAPAPLPLSFFLRQYGQRTTPSLRQTCLRAVSEMPKALAASFCGSPKSGWMDSMPTFSGGRPFSVDGVAPWPFLRRGKSQTCTQRPSHEVARISSRTRIQLSTDRSVRTTRQSSGDAAQC
jgi:hypothetical protein